MFESIPANFSSLFSELNYTFVTSESRDITLSICDAHSQQLCGSKRVYGSCTATVNIAPIIREYALPVVAKSQSGFTESYNAGVIAVVVEEEQGESAESRTFLLARGCTQEGEILTTLPMDRTIVSGESDMITIRCQQGASLTARVSYYAYQGDESILVQSFQIDDVESGVAIFNFLMDDQLSSVELESVRVEFEQVDSDGVSSELGRINYIVIDPPQTPLRLAWISSAGSIEHYTFPKIDKIIRGVDAKLQLSISSALETSAVRRTLSEILCSQRVWLDRGDSYEQVGVVSTTIEIAKVRELERMSIVIECLDI